MSDDLEAFVRIATILTLIVVTMQKLIVMQRETRKWNGLGRALRFEKAIMLLFWLWVLLRLIWEPLQSVWSLVAMAILLVIGEVRVSRHLPGFVVRMREDKTARDIRQDQRTLRQDIRERKQDRRGEFQDKRGWEQSRQSVAQGDEARIIESDQHAQNQREVHADQREHDLDERDANRSTHS